MGMLDNLLGEVIGSALGGGQNRPSNNPLASLLGGLSGGNQSQGSNLLTAALSMLQASGGVSGLVNMFHGNGLGQEADSWVGTGANMNISPNQLQQVFGSSQLSSLAKQFGMSEQQTGSALSQLLPELVNQLTPQGNVPNNEQDLITQALGMLGRR